MDYGMLVYDVPTTRKAVYNKLRARLGRQSVMVTWSCYLIPWGNRDLVLGALKELDESEDTKDRIYYRCIKQDPSANGELDELVKSEFEKNLRKAKDDLNQAVGEAEMAAEGQEIGLNEWAGEIRAGCRKAAKKVSEARKLAMVFGVTDVMETAFAAMEKLVESKRERVKAELKAEKEKEKAEEAARKAEEASEQAKLAASS